MIQEIAIGILFLGASAYLGWKLYKTFSAKSTCENCSCSAIPKDFNIKSEEVVK